MIKKLDWYFIKKFIGTFFFSLLIMAVISSVIDYSEKVKDFAIKKPSTIEILGYYQDFIPHILALLFALFIFIATIYFTSKLAYKSEIIAFLSTGASFARFLRPYIIGGAFLSTLSLISNHFLVPTANKSRLAFEDKYIHEAVSYSDQNVHLRLTPNLYVFVQSYDYNVNSGYRFSSEVFDGIQLKERITAERVSYDSTNKLWILTNVTTITNDGIKESLKIDSELKKSYPFKPSDLYEDNTIKESLTTPELNKLIKKEKLRGSESLNVYYIEKYRRTAQPVAGLILTIIGVCIASKKVRGGSGLHLALGILICAIYMLLLQLSQTFSIKSNLDPLVAVWIPNFIFAGYAYYLYLKQIK